MPPPNDLCTGALALTVPSTRVLDTTTATDDPSTPDSDWGSGNSYNGVWFTWTVPTGWTRLGITMQDANGEGVLTVFEGTCGSLAPPAEGQGGYSSPSGSTRINDAFVPGQTYYFLVTSYDPGGMSAQTLTLFHPEPAGDVCTVVATPSYVCVAPFPIDSEISGGGDTGGGLPPCGSPARHRRLPHGPVTPRPERPVQPRPQRR
jgi:hypothetical protein